MKLREISVGQPCHPGRLAEGRVNGVSMWSLTEDLEQLLRFRGAMRPTEVSQYSPSPMHTSKTADISLAPSPKHFVADTQKGPGVSQAD